MPPTCHACFKRPSVFSRDVLLADAQEALTRDPTFVPETHAWMTFELCLPCAATLDRERAADRARGRPVVSRLAHRDDGTISPSTLASGD